MYERRTKRKIRSSARVGLLALVIFLSSCGSSVDIYRLQSIGWKQDSIALVVREKTGDAPVRGLGLEVTCLTCNFHEPPWFVRTNTHGQAALLIPEAQHLVSVRLGIQGSGIDTVGVLLQPPPEVATQRHRLSTPLTGRVLMTGLSMLYADSTMDSSVATVNLQDELNMFEEGDSFYLVHHPQFSHPVYLRKLGVIRLQ